MGSRQKQQEIYDRFVDRTADPIDIAAMTTDELTRQISDMVEENHTGLPGLEEITSTIHTEAIRLVAECIHREVCGCGDKRCEITGDIAEWLETGDLRDSPSIDQLIQEYQESES